MLWCIDQWRYGGGDRPVKVAFVIVLIVSELPFETFFFLKKKYIDRIQYQLLHSFKHTIQYFS